MYDSLQEARELEWIEATKPEIKEKKLGEKWATLMLINKRYPHALLLVFISNKTCLC